MWFELYNSSGIYPDDLATFTLSSSGDGETRAFITEGGQTRLNQTITDVGVESYIRYDSIDSFGYSTGTSYIIFREDAKSVLQTYTFRWEFWRAGDDDKYDFTCTATACDGTTLPNSINLADGKYHWLKINNSASALTISVDGYKVKDITPSTSANAGKLFWRVNDYITTAGKTSISYLDLMTFNKTFNEQDPLATTLGGQEKVSGVGMLSQQYDSNIYEAQATRYNISVSTTLADVGRITGDLWYNGTNVSHTTYANTSATDYTYNKTLIPNLTVEDSNSLTAYWNFSIIYLNGTQLVNQTTQEFTQTLGYSYYFSSVNATPDEIVALDTTKAQTTLYKRNSLATTTAVQLYFNNTTYTPTNAGSEYYKTVSTPFVSSDQNLSFNYGMSVIYAGQTILRNSSTADVSVLAVSIRNCSDNGRPTLNFTYWDEESPYTPINASMETTLWIWKGDQNVNTSYNFSFDSAHEHSLCLYPNTTNVTTFSILQYWNELDNNNLTYPSRNYYLNGVYLSNSSTTYPLYLLNNTFASAISISVQDEYSDPAPLIIGKVQRYYVGENIYRTVAVFRTDEQGDAMTRLRLSTGSEDVFYRFVMEQGFTVIRTIDKAKITSTTLTIDLTLADLNEYWEYWDKVGASCSFTNATRLLQCQWDDTSGKFVSANLLVKKTQITGYSTICNTNSTEPEGLMTCDLSSQDSSKTYQYILSFQMEDTTFVGSTGFIEQTNAQRYGTSGVFAVLMLLLIMGFLAIYSPEMSIVGSVIVVILSYMLQLMTLSYAAVLGLIVAAAILIYLVNKRG